ncbi:hypothetical protein C8Q75DRAFT_839608 [Abortiporus biennis]|nr:hypothetical protein C8Q75DRAFT_839608 [Abortiporus biennis]
MTVDTPLVALVLNLLSTLGIFKFKSVFLFPVVDPTVSSSTKNGRVLFSSQTTRCRVTLPARSKAEEGMEAQLKVASELIVNIEEQGREGGKEEGKRIIVVDSVNWFGLVTTDYAIEIEDDIFLLPMINMAGFFFIAEIELSKNLSLK